VSRASFGFTAFVTVLAAGLLTVAWLLGPDKLAFLFDGERQTAPFVMVNLGEAAEPPPELVSAMVERLGGDPLWSATTERVIDGGRNDEWPLIALIAHPSRAHFVDQLGLRGLGNLTGLAADRLERSAVLAATSEQTFAINGARAFAVRLVAGVDDLARVDAEQWRERETEVLAAHGGLVVWRARLRPLDVAREERFDQLTVFGFASVQGRDRWLEDPARATDMALQSRVFQRQIMLAVAPVLLNGD
jgi:hypothetical protein